MSRKWSQKEPGWGTTSEEYLNHVNRMQRMPTVSAVGVSRYPNLHMIMKKKAGFNQECGGDNESCNMDQASDSEKKDASEKQDDEVKKNGSPLKLHKWGNFKSI